jgi:outer membrane protein TolC
MIERNEATLAGEKLETEELHERIAQRAYQLYETRGRVDGYDVQDWLEAEQELLSRVEYSAKSGGAKR